MIYLTDLVDLTARGVSRDRGDERAVSVSFNRPLTDDELRWLHDHLRHGIQHNFQHSAQGCRFCDFDPRKEYRVRSSVPTSDNCEHGIPRRFCTAVHAPTVSGESRDA